MAAMDDYDFSSGLILCSEFSFSKLKNWYFDRYQAMPALRTCLTWRLVKFALAGKELCDLQKFNFPIADNCSVKQKNENF